MVALDERFIQALQAGARAWRQALERELKAAGLTPAGWSALAALAGRRQAGEPDPSQTELAQQLSVDGATLVATIDRLAASGLIARAPGPHDRRIKLVVLTEEGGRVERTVRAGADALRREALSRLDAAELEVAAGVLERLQALLGDA